MMRRAMKRLFLYVLVGTGFILLITKYMDGLNVYKTYSHRNKELYPDYVDIIISNEELEDKAKWFFKEKELFTKEKFLKNEDKIPETLKSRNHSQLLNNLQGTLAYHPVRMETKGEADNRKLKHKFYLHHENDKRTRFAEGKLILNIDELKKKRKDNIINKKIEQDPFLKPVVEAKTIQNFIKNKTPFNFELSDLVSVTRNIPDTRSKECLYRGSTNDIIITNDVTVTVVIVHRNERKSAFFRTLASVMRQTPSWLLERVIVVDDASEDRLSMQLERMLPSLSIVRNLKKLGVANSRTKGASFTNSSHIVFLDSHTEVNRNWLQPLVKASLLALQSPVLDIINSFTLNYRAPNVILKGGFTWGLSSTWMKLKEPKTGTNWTKPFKSPVTAGGMFLIDRSWWNTLGGYDSGFEGWGGDGIEISLKSWMCGGSVEVVPCSRVGHIFTASKPSQLKSDLRNTKRIADVWLGQFSKFFYEARPKAPYVTDGDISPQEDLRDKLKCHSFSWYLSRVYPELLTPAWIPLRSGVIRQRTSCLYSAMHKSSRQATIGPLWRGECADASLLVLTVDGLLVYKNKWCVSADPPVDVRVAADWCRGNRNMRWEYDVINQTLLHVASSLCLDSSSLDTVILMQCMPDNLSQNWIFEN